MLGRQNRWRDREVNEATTSSELSTQSPSAQHPIHGGFPPQSHLTPEYTRGPPRPTATATAPAPLVGLAGPAAYTATSVTTQIASLPSQ